MCPLDSFGTPPPEVITPSGDLLVGEILIYSPVLDSNQNTCRYDWKKHFPVAVEDQGWLLQATLWRLWIRCQQSCQQTRHGITRGCVHKVRGDYSNIICKLSFSLLICRLDRASNMGVDRISGFAKSAAFDVAENNIREDSTFDFIRVWFNNKGWIFFHPATACVE